MKLTPMDINNKEFKRVLRGYCPEEVDEFLDQIVEEYEILFKENTALKEKLENSNDKIEHYSKIENTIQNTLLLAQNTAEQAKANAQKEADVIIKSANDTAQRILDKAHNDVIQINDEYDRVKQEFTKFRAKFRSFMNFQIDTFDDLEKDFIKNFNITKPEDQTETEVPQGIQIDFEEEKEEVKELIYFLKAPKKFQKLGARIPKGVLLMGPPGTGKTLLAKAVAGEADVPFYFISGSDFVELFVGVGASRVRDMFQQAKRTAPCLIFIDEIDAVGRQRGSGIGGGHDEREQTLNQLLTEMDGFGANEGIIIIAATNRPDVLDPALLRPGRFDRQITVNLPDIKGREEILAVHAKNKILADGITLKNLAKRTPGFSGADLENLLNEAALLAVRRNKSEITMSEIDEATDRVLMGPAKTSHKYSENDRKLVAYHEAGHAVIGLKLRNASDVQKVTIIPRGQAGGYNMMVPSEEKFCSTKTDLLEEITGLLGGRTAEEITFGEITTGAHNDFEKATKIARAMVTEYGMSDLGPLQFEQQSGSVFLGRDYNKPQHFSNEVANEIDMEMRKIINNCHKQAKEIITKNKDLLELIAETLLEYETLTKEQIDYLVENGHMPEEDKTDNYESMSTTKLREIAKEKGIKNYSKMSKAELLKELDV